MTLDEFGLLALALALFIRGHGLVADVGEGEAVRVGEGRHPLSRFLKASSTPP